MAPPRSWSVLQALDVGHDPLASPAPRAGWAASCPRSRRRSWRPASRSTRGCSSRRRVTVAPPMSFSSWPQMPLKLGPTPLRAVDAVAGAAALLAEDLLADLEERARRSACPRRAQASKEAWSGWTTTTERHGGVVGPAVLGAEDGVGPGHGGGEDHLGEAPGHGVLLEPELAARTGSGSTSVEASTSSTGLPGHHVEVLRPLAARVVEPPGPLPPRHLDPLRRWRRGRTRSWRSRPWWRPRRSRTPGPAGWPTRRSRAGWSGPARPPAPGATARAR